MRCSIAIAAHNEGSLLWKTVASCVETTGDLDCEIVVADDASDDGSVAEVARRFPDVRIVRHERRLGVSPTKNLAARTARGQVLVFLDGHCRPEPGAIATLVEDVVALRTDAIVTPSIPALDAETWKACDQRIGHGYALDLETLEGRWLGLEDLRPDRRVKGRRLYRQPTVVGCCLAVGRSTYERLWGFDTGMTVYGSEDVDFGLKAWLMDVPVLHDPVPHIAHRFRGSFDGGNTPIDHIIANQLRMARKFFSPATWPAWLSAFRDRFPVESWDDAWKLFEQGGHGLEHERAYLVAHRLHDEFWYAREFGLNWSSGNQPISSMVVVPAFSIPPDPTKTPPPPEKIKPSIPPPPTKNPPPTEIKPSIPPDPTKTPPPPQTQPPGKRAAGTAKSKSATKPSKTAAAKPTRAKKPPK